MFHHAHSFIASKLYKSEDPLLLIGSIIPDIAVVKIITWDKGLHGEKNVKKFRKFIEKHLSFTNLLNGIIAHNILDNFTHIEYHQKPGFAFQNTEKITKSVMKYYGLSKKRAKGITHNYIESAVDILILKQHPKIQDNLKLAIKKTDKQILANLLGLYFHIDQYKFSDALTNFFDEFTKYDFSKEENWIYFWGDLEKLLSLKDTKTKEREELLNQSLELVKNTYKDFIDYSLLKGKTLAK